MSGTDHLISEIVAELVVWVFIIAALAGVALGVGLNINSARTLQFLRATNRWISVRKKLKQIEISRDIDQAILRRRRWSGTVFALGGAYTVLMLLFVVEFPYVVVALSKYARPVVVEILTESLRWLLLLGGLLAFGVGVVMLVSERALKSLQDKLNRSISIRRFSKAANEMHMTLDNLAEAYPRATGLVLALLSTLALLAAMVVWIER
ncbi:MAG: hypothetical protein GTO41_12560 [Burkholderiales bacterium]|nr:hypothetical protein [Burkholderiales bacterium]